MNRVEHTLKPIYNENSKVLILGSMPSIKSRESRKYYGNKNNRFWGVLEAIYGVKIDDWEKFILDNHLALWDVIESCDIENSSDSSIKNVKINDIKMLVDKSEIKHIFLLGKLAYNLYVKYVYPELKIDYSYLPSPSSANASYSFEKLVKEYEVIKKISQ